MVSHRIKIFYYGLHRNKNKFNLVFNSLFGLKMIFKLVLTRFSDLSYKTEIKIKNRIKILVFNSVSNRIKNILIRFDTELKNILMWFYFGFILVLFRFLTWFFNSVDRIKNQIKNQLKNRIKRARF